MDEQLRINKYLSSIGYCSRREADRLLEQGKIQVDGHTAFVGERITKEQYITVNGIPVGEKPREIVIAFNKPKGIVCTSSVKEKNNIVDYLHFPTRIYPVGRLDKDSTGLILLTNDGELTDRIRKKQSRKRISCHSSKTITSGNCTRHGTGSSYFGHHDETMSDHSN